MSAGWAGQKEMPGVPSRRCQVNIMPLGPAALPDCNLAKPSTFVAIRLDCLKATALQRLCDSQGYLLNQDGLASAAIDLR